MAVDLSRPAIRARSKLLSEDYPPQEPQGGDGLQAYTDDSAVIVAGVTGRIIPPIAEGEPVPTELEGIATRCVAMVAERMSVQTDADSAEDIASGQILRSISAGPWSETYMSPGELDTKVRNGGQSGRVLVYPDNPLLSDLLWQLMTQAQRDYWTAIQSGLVQPQAGYQAFDYRLSPPYGGFGGGGYC